MFLKGSSLRIKRAEDEEDKKPKEDIEEKKDDKEEEDKPEPVNKEEGEDTEPKPPKEDKGIKIKFDGDVVINKGNKEILRFKAQDFDAEEMAAFDKKDVEFFAEKLNKFKELGLKVDLGDFGMVTPSLETKQNVPAPGAKPVPGAPGAAPQPGTKPTPVAPAPKPQPWGKPKAPAGQLPAGPPPVNSIIPPVNQAKQPAPPVPQPQASYNISDRVFSIKTAEYEDGYTVKEGSAGKVVDVYPDLIGILWDKDLRKLNRLTPPVDIMKATNTTYMEFKTKKAFTQIKNREAAMAELEDWVRTIWNNLKNALASGIENAQAWLQRVYQEQIQGRPNEGTYKQELINAITGQDYNLAPLEGAEQLVTVLASSGNKRMDKKAASKEYLAECDECGKRFTIRKDESGNTQYTGEECDCEAPFSTLEEKEASSNKRMKKKAENKLIPEIGDEIRYIGYDGLVTVDKIEDVYGEQVETEYEKLGDIEDLEWADGYWKIKNQDLGNESVLESLASNVMEPSDYKAFKRIISHMLLNKDSEVIMNDLNKKADAILNKYADKIVKAEDQDKKPWGGKEYNKKKTMRYDKKTMDENTNVGDGQNAREFHGDSKLNADPSEWSGHGLGG